MTELLLQPVADAFLQVGVFVALMLGVFGYLQYRTGARLTRSLARSRRLAPLVGAVLGVVPGCGGAIVVMPLYLRGTVSFGTVVAALVATMGDASFVLFAAAPAQALRVHAILLAVGVVSGYLTDAVGVDPARCRRTADGVADVVPRRGACGAAGGLRPVPVAAGTAALSSAVLSGPWVPGSSGQRALPPHATTGAAAVPLETAPKVFWWLAAGGFVVGAPVLTGAMDTAALARLLGGVDAYLLVGVLGALAAVVVYVRHGGGACDDTVQSIEDKWHNLADVFRHGARETAFVTVWVAIAYLVTTWLIVLGGVDLAVVAGLTGVAGVLVGAAVGLVPGCAVQVILTGLYVTGVVPFATLVANAVCQDGDALFPVIMMDRRAAVVASVLTSVPAVLVGFAVLAVG